MDLRVLWIGGLTILLTCQEVTVQAQDSDTSSDPETIQRLLGKLKDSDRAVRAEAGTSLLKIGGPAVEPLIAILGDPDPSVRARAALLLGRIGDARAVEPLIAVFGDSDPTVRYAAAHVLLIADVPVAEAMVKGILDKDPKRQAQIREAISPIWEKLSEPMRLKLAPLLLPSPSNRDSCEVLCTLVQPASAWMAGLEQPEFREKPLDWKFAIRSLKWLFLTRASDVCPKAKESLNRWTASWTQLPGREAIPSQLLDLPAEGDGILLAEEAGARAESSRAYGKIFFIRLLEELATKVAESAQTRVNESLPKSRKSLSGDLVEARRGGPSGSIFQTHLISASTLVLADTPEGKDSVRGMTQKMISVVPYGGELRIPYVLDIRLAGSDRDSAARAVPFYLSLYQNIKSQNKEAMQKQMETNLVAALQNYVKHVNDLMMNVPRDQTHLGSDQLAPYYFYSTVPYVSSAIALLASEETVKPDSEQKGDRLRVLETLRTQILQALFQMYDSEKKLFMAQGATDTRLYFSSSSYVNPLAGLALIPLIQTCEGKPVPKSYGIMKGP
jgi:hypothetical protein